MGTRQGVSAPRRSLWLPDPHAAFAVFLAQMGRTDEAIVHATKAVELDPLWPTAHYRLSEILVAAGRFDEASERARVLLELEPGHVWPQVLLLIAGAGRKSSHEVETVSKRVRQHLQDSAFAEGALGWAYAVAGLREEALKVLAVLNQRRVGDYAHPYWIAVIHLGLGEHDQALDWLEKGYQERDGLMVWLNIVFAWDAVRADPRFQALLRRMNFPETTASG